MNEILKEITPKPEILITDNGSEFISKPFETLINDNNISHDFANVGDHKKLGIVDRFVRTLRELINRYMIANKTNKYINVFQDLIFNYNNSYHRGIKGKSAKVAINSPKLMKIMKEKDKLANEEEQQFYVGDNVRYIKNKVMFEKGTAPKWSEILHKIIKANKHSYVLDNNKSYKYYEVKKNVIVENTPIIEEIQPTRPTIRKENKRLRAHEREGIDESTINNEKRIPKLKEQFKSLLSR